MHADEAKPSVTRAIVKARAQLSKEIARGFPDPSQDTKFESVLDGVDRIGSGFDASTGEIRLPTMVWKTYKDDACGDGKTGRWCDNAATDSSFKRDQIPTAMAVTRETAARSTMARRVFSSTKELARSEAERMGFRSPVGVLTQDGDIEALREVQAHSDLLLARREQRLYSLKMYPFSEQAKDTAFIKSELVDALIGNSGLTNAFVDDREAAAARLREHKERLTVPDCVLHDCMLRDEVNDMPTAGCTFEGMTVSVPACADLFGAKGQENLRDGCKSKFFIPLPNALSTKVSKLTNTCASPKDERGAHDAGPADATCSAFGEDLGTVCNANDMARLGAFVKRWGTHFIESASFGGEMEVQVQLRKDRGARLSRDGEARSDIGATTRRGSIDSVREATDFARRPIDIPTTSANEEAAADSAVLEPQQASTSASRATTPRKGRLLDDARGEATGIGGDETSIINAVFASGVELGQDARRAHLARAGVENIAVSFSGGTDMPASESAVTRDQVDAWAASVQKAPALLRQTLGLRPIFELLDHPSVMAAVEDQAAELVGMSKDDENDAKKSKAKKSMTSLMRQSLKRKRALLENFLRWFMAKSEALGSALDRASANRAKSEAQLHSLGGFVSEWTAEVRKESGLTQAVETTGAAVALNDKSSGLRGVIAHRSDQVAVSQEEVSAETLLTYVLAYRKGASRFAAQCKDKCRAEEKVLLKRGTMYGEFHVEGGTRDKGGPTAAPFGLSGDSVAKDVTDAKFILRRNRDRCERTCRQQQVQSIRNSKQIAVMEQKVSSISETNAAEGGVRDELSVDAFFAGVDGACTICDGLVRTLASGQLPAMGNGVADARDICHNKLFAASKDDLSNPMSDDFNLDAELDERAGDSGIDGGADGEDDGDSDDVSTKASKKKMRIKTHGSAVCLGVVGELEDRMRTILQEHGLAMPTRSQLADLIRTWRSHSTKTAPKALAHSLCRRFVHCSEQDLPDASSDTNVQTAELSDAIAKRAGAEASLARLQEQIKKIDATVKKLPKEQQKAMKDRKATLSTQVKNTKAEIKTDAAEEKVAKALDKVTTDAETEAENFCHFTCLAQTKWGKEYEKVHAKKALAMSERRPRDDVVATRAAKPCGIEIRQKREKKCEWCGNRDCVAEARKQCFMKGSTTRCDSRWMMQDGEYVDALMSYTVGARL
jgi:hypothetical protein